MGTDLIRGFWISLSQHCWENKMLNEASFYATTIYTLVTMLDEAESLKKINITTD